MRLATLTLPIADNAGADTTDVHSALRLVLIDTFGGYTATRVNGGWRDDTTGKVYSDESVVYSIAMDESDTARGKLESIARFYGHLAGQISIMVTHAGGDAAFIDCHAPQREMAL